MKKWIKDIFSVLLNSERRTMFRLIIFDVLVSIFDIAFLAMLVYVIHFYTQKDHLPFPRFFSSPVFHQFPLLPGVVFLIAFAIKNWIAFRVYKAQYHFVYSVASRLSENNLLHYLEGGFDEFINIDSAVQLRKINQQPIEFGHYILAGFQQVIGQSILILITIIAIVIYSPVLFPLLFVILAIPVIIISIILKRKLAGARKMAKPLSEKSLQYLKEALSGYVESNIYDAQHFFISRYSFYQSRYNDFLANQISIQNIPSRVIEIFAILGLFMLVLISTYMGGSGAISTFTIGAFMAAAYKIIPGIVKILNSAGQLKTFRFTIEGLRKDRYLVKDKIIQHNNTINSISFSNITFSYKEKKVLDNFSMKIAGGDFIGLSGLSGKGKTTFVNLFLGFIDVSSGRIEINDTLTTRKERQQYWRHIAYVKQQPFIINESIVKNITLSEQYDEERLKAVMASTGLDLFISQYSEGINTLITENGKNISGGQRQRIVIARALYKNADLIILDEPFNELDREAENKLLNLCKKLAGTGKMIILITHDQESLSYCSKIISLNEK